jgi:hypothetical protein
MRKLYIQILQQSILALNTNFQPDILKFNTHLENKNLIEFKELMLEIESDISKRFLKLNLELNLIINIDNIEGTDVHSK